MNFPVLGSVAREPEQNTMPLCLMAWLSCGMGAGAFWVKTAVGAMVAKDYG